MLLFHVLAPEEIEFPFERLTQFRSLERAGDEVLLDPHLVREEYLRNFRSFCDDLKAQAASLEIDYHLLRTDEPVDRALGLYISKRQAHGAGR